MEDEEIWDKMAKIFGEEKVPFSCLFDFMHHSELESFLEFLEFEIENGIDFEGYKNET